MNTPLSNRIIIILVIVEYSLTIDFLKGSTLAVEALKPDTTAVLHCAKLLSRFAEALHQNASHVTAQSSMIINSGGSQTFHCYAQQAANSASAPNELSLGTAFLCSTASMQPAPTPALLIATPILKVVPGPCIPFVPHWLATLGSYCTDAYNYTFFVDRGEWDATWRFPVGLRVHSVFKHSRNQMGFWSSKIQVSDRWAFAVPNVSERIFQEVGDIVAIDDGEILQWDLL